MKSLIKVFRLRFACGSTGYEEIIKSGMPLAYIRTLTKQLENVSTKCGILKEVFEFLKIKAPAFCNDINKDCMIVIDEVSITTGKGYDSANRTFLGHVSLADKSNSRIMD